MALVPAFSRFFLVLLAGLALCTPAGAQLPVWQSRDVPGAEAANVDDRDWQPLDTLPARPGGIFWIRTTLDVSEGLDAYVAPAISVTASGAYEIYLDGRLLARAGQLPSATSTGRAAPALAHYGIGPGWLEPGRHRIAVRASADMLPVGEDFVFLYELADMPDLVRLQRYRDWVDGAAGFSALFLCLAFLALRYWRQERRDMDLAAAVSACVFGIVILDPQARAFDLALLPAGLRDALLLCLSLIVFALTPWLIYSRLKLKALPVWAACLAAGFLLSMLPLGPWEHDARAFALLMLILAAMSLSALGRLPGAALAHAGGAVLALGSILLAPDFLTGFLAVGLALLSVSLIVELMTSELLRRRRDARMARLQSDLVKRNIQPHFIMNSLMVASEFQETDPATARKFIASLAAEFGALAAMIDTPRTCLRQELALCHSHLEMMGLRLGLDFRLEVMGADGAREFPPGVLHTLIENAISHNRYDADVVFRLSVGTSARGLTYVLHAPLGRPGPGSAASSGAGMRYVESRLEEFAPGRWSLSSGEEDGDWVTRIGLPDGLP